LLELRYAIVGVSSKSKWRASEEGSSNWVKVCNYYNLLIPHLDYLPYYHLLMLLLDFILHWLLHFLNSMWNSHTAMQHWKG
jgi:hypothetical protein